MINVIILIQGEPKKKRELLKCVVAAMYSWQHCGAGTLSYRKPRHLVIMDQWNGQQCAFAIKMFYKNNDSLEVAQREFQFFCVSLYMYRAFFIICNSTKESTIIINI